MGENCGLNPEFKSSARAKQNSSNHETPNGWGTNGHWHGDNDWYSKAQYSRYWNSNAAPQYSGSWADENDYSWTSNAAPHQNGFWDYDDEFYSFNQFRNYRPRTNTTPVYTRIDAEGNVRYYVFANDYYDGSGFYDAY